MKSFFWFAGFFASVTAFILSVLEILKNHLGVDTQAFLYSLGDAVGGTLVWLQDTWSAFLQNFSFGGFVNELAQDTIVTIVTVLLGIIFRFFGRRSARKST